MAQIPNSLVYYQIMSSYSSTSMLGNGYPSRLSMPFFKWINLNNPKGICPTLVILVATRFRLEGNNERILSHQSFNFASSYDADLDARAGWLGEEIIYHALFLEYPPLSVEVTRA